MKKQPLDFFERLTRRLEDTRLEDRFGALYTAC